MTVAILAIDHIPLTRAERDHLYLLLVILRWITCDHKKFYWMNGVDGYYCPVCERTGYGYSPLYDSNFRSS